MKFSTRLEAVGSSVTGDVRHDFKMKRKDKQWEPGIKRGFNDFKKKTCKINYINVDGVGRREMRKWEKCCPFSRNFRLFINFNFSNYSRYMENQNLSKSGRRLGVS